MSWIVQALAWAYWLPSGPPVLDFATNFLGSWLSVSWSHTCSWFWRVLVVGACCLSGAITWVTYNWVAMTLLQSYSVPWFQSSSLYILVNPPVWSYNIIVTGSDWSNKYITSASFIWCNSTQPETSWQSYNGWSVNFSITNSSTVNNCYHYAVVSTSIHPNTFSAWANTSILSQDGWRIAWFWRNTLVSPAWSSTIGWTSSNGTENCVLSVMIK